MTSTDVINGLYLCVALGYDLAEADVTLVMMMMIYVILFWANVLGYVIRNV